MQELDKKERVGPWSALYSKHEPYRETGEESLPDKFLQLESIWSVKWMTRVQNKQLGMENECQ